MLKSGYVTVMVSDFDRSMLFYTETLGLRLKYRAGNEWAEAECPGLTVGLHAAGPHGPRPGPEGALSIGFQVDDLTEAMDSLASRGVRFAPRVVEDGPVRLAFFGDPDGNPLYLCQVLERATA